MFTGLVESLGILEGRAGGKLLVRPAEVLKDPVIGESIAVNGCCLTLEHVSSQGVLEFHTLEETLRRTNLGHLPAGALLNLERAMQLGGRLGGHLVQGHIDTAAEVRQVARRPDGDFAFTVELPAAYAALVVEKGSIAIDGVSLTVAALDEESFSVCLIPQTLKATALARRTPGTCVNLEFDVLGRYLLRSLELRKKNPAVTMQTLLDAGF